MGKPPSVWDKEAGKPRLLSAQCSTCIFRPGNLMDLRPGRLKSMVESVQRTGSIIPCHQTLYRKGFRPAICRGMADRYYTTYLQLADRLLGGCLVVDLPEDGHG